MSAKTKQQLEEELARAHRREAQLSEQVHSLQAVIAQNLAATLSQEELSSALERETALFSDGPVVIFHLAADANPMIQYVSPNIAQFGYPASDFIAGRRRYAHLICLEDRPRVRDFAHQQQNDPHIPFYENTYRIQCADSSQRWVYDFTRITRAPDGRPTHYYFYIFDITDRINAYQELKIRQDLLDALVAQSYDGIRLVDEEGRVLVWNQAIAAITGIPPSRRWA